jgi:iron complex transport system substrate-binding protein
MSGKALAKLPVIAILLIIIVAAVGAIILAFSPLITNPSGNFTVVDMAGKTVQVPSTVSRVVIINSYWAEIACCIGAQDKIVGIGQDVTSSVYIPAQVKNLTVVGDLFNGVNLETIVSLRPDLVITDYSYGIAGNLISSLQSLNISVVEMSTGSFSTEINAVKLLGKVLDENNNASQLATYMQNGQASIDNAVAGLNDTQKPTVLICNLNVWSSGLIYCYSNSTWGNAVDEVGGINVALRDQPSQSWYKVDLEQLLKWNPDIIIVLGRDNASLASQLQIASLNSSWGQLKAVSSGNVYPLLIGSKVQGAFLDDGPRTYIGLIELGKIIQPSHYQSMDLNSSISYLLTKFYNLQN